jgi:hypothetical protein
MKNSILTLVSVLALGTPALAQTDMDTTGGATTMTQSSQTTKVDPAVTQKTTTTTKKPAPVAVQSTTTTHHRTSTGVSVRPTNVVRNTTITPNSASSTTTVQH